MVGTSSPSVVECRPRARVGSPGKKEEAHRETADGRHNRRVEVDPLRIDRRGS
jgi:hypothetical protein